jgi:hypothetical protein
MDDVEKESGSKSAAADPFIEAYAAAAKKGDIRAQGEAAVAFMAYASDTAQQEPSQDLLLMQEARHYESLGLWSDAEDAYRRRLALAESESNYWQIYKAQDAVSTLHGFLGQHDLSLEEARASLLAARRANSKGLLKLAFTTSIAVELRGDNAFARCHYSSGHSSNHILLVGDFSPIEIETRRHNRRR